MIRPRVLCLLALLCAAARAQPGLPAEPGATHGWLVSRSLVGGGVSLFHVPPRASEGGPGAESGVAIVQRTLDTVPTAVAGWREQVYCLYQADNRIDVFSFRAVSGGLAGYWLVEPRTGATTEPSLARPGGLLRDAAGAAGNLVALTGDEQPRLWRLAGGAWSELTIPDRLGGVPAASLRLVQNAGRVGLVHLDARTTLFQLFDDGVWRSWSHDITLARDQLLECFAWGADTCALVWSPERGVEVWLIDGRGVRLIADPRPGRPASVAHLEGGARLVALRTLRNDDAAGRAEPIERWEITEHSLATGSVLYAGPPTAGDWVTPDLRVLSLGMIAFVLGVLFYMLQPSGRSREIVLPPGVALASPGTRMLSALVDAALVAFGVGLATGTPVLHILLVVPLAETPEGVGVGVVFVGLCVLYTTLAEWALGRTLGKAMGGCRVVSVVPGRDRPGLLRIGARNVFRWCFVPWAIIGLAAPDLRHRGDRVAGTAVVVPTDSGPPDQPGTDDRPG